MDISFKNMPPPKTSVSPPLSTPHRSEHGATKQKRTAPGALWASLLLTLLLLAACGGSSSGSPITSLTIVPTAVPTPTPIPVTQAAAIVNGNPVPLWSYHFYLRALQQQQAAGQKVPAATLASEAMNEILGDELVREYAVAHGLDATQAEINTRVAADEKQLGGKAGLIKRLAPLGLTFDQYVSLTAAGIRRHNVAARVAPVEYAHVRHILIGTTVHKPHRTDAAAHALAETILRQVQNGGNFAALARRYSDDASGKKGGDLGNICPGQMVAPFDQASFTAPLNHPTLVHSQYGYHIVEVLARAPATSAQCPAQQVADPEQGPAFIAWIRNQIKQAKVKRLVTA